MRHVYATMPVSYVYNPMALLHLLAICDMRRNAETRSHVTDEHDCLVLRDLHNWQSLHVVPNHSISRILVFLP